jgi:DNA-binding CsgD family transcriptional regulator
MLNSENSLRQKRSEPVLVLLNSSFKPVSYNAEAIRVLTYTSGLAEIPSTPSVIETTLRPILSALRVVQPFIPLIPPIFQSGRRQYRVRIFSLNKLQDDSASRPAHALMLERQDCGLVDISSAAALYHLTPREQQALGHLMQGMTSKEIANEMGVSPHTVKAFLRLVMGKLQVSTRSGIIGRLIGVRV